MEFSGGAPGRLAQIATAESLMGMIELALLLMMLLLLLFNRVLLVLLLMLLMMLLFLLLVHFPLDQSLSSEGDVLPGSLRNIVVCFQFLLHF